MGLSGATHQALNGQCGKIGGFAGEHILVKLDRDQRVVKVKCVNVVKEGGNALWTTNAPPPPAGNENGFWEGLGQRLEDFRAQASRSKIEERWVGREARLGVTGRPPICAGRAEQG